MTPRARALDDQLSLWVGRALALGEDASSLLARLVVVLILVLAGWVAYRVSMSLLRRVLRRPADGTASDGTRAQRVRTLVPFLSSIIRYLVAFVVGMLVLQELGVDVRALAVSAGVAGLAIGFGAQSLIKDVISGLFILFERLIAVGDVIEVGAHTGVVESVGIRVTKIRKFSGELRIVPNGELTAFGQHTAGWSRAVVEVGIPYDEDVSRALGTLDTLGHEFRAAHAGAVLEQPVVEGILRFGESDMLLRLHARVTAAEKFPLELALRRRVKEGFDAAGLRVGPPRMLVRVDLDRRVPARDPNQKEPVS